jgi:DNA modification methylase
MRLKALTGLGAKEAWVSVVEPKTEAEKVEIALSDNDRVGRYDKGLLEDLVLEFKDEIQLDDFSVDLKAPLSLDDLMGNYSRANEKDDEVPEVPKEAITRPGDLWVLGDHRLLCGDSTKREDVERLMAGEKADMIFTDPPYGMNLDTDFSSMVNNLNFAKDKNVKKGKKYNPVIGDNKDYDPKHIFDFFGYVKEVFLFGADYYAEKLTNKNNGSWFVWDKRLDESADKMYGSCFELIWSKEKHKREIFRVKWASIFGVEKEFDHKRHHPTQKPIALIEFIVNKITEKNWLVVDLFLGSGSTLIACEKLNRKCYGMELDPLYCDVIVKRWEDFTGQKAEGTSL